jgi:predicted PurR-regulated permease PerM
VADFDPGSAQGARGIDMTGQSSDLARTTLSVLFIGGLIAGSLWILSPFIAAFIWAVMIVVATWPLMLRVERLLWGRRSLAVATMSLALLAILIVPITVAIDAILKHTADLAALAARLVEAQLPPAPGWLVGLPIVGERVAATWNDLAGEGLPDLIARAEPHARAAVAWLAQHAGGFAMLLVNFLLIVILAAVLYSGGEVLGRSWIRRFGWQLAGVSWRAHGRARRAGHPRRRTWCRGDRMVQSALGGIGLAIAGVPFASVLTAMMFALCIAQIGPILVLLAATAWAYPNLGAGWGTFLLVWSLVVGLMDNFVRPILIRKGADLPLLLIFAGVIGGLVAFGVIGIFVGPVVLAVAYTLLDNWVGSPPPGNPAGHATGITTNSPSSTPTA